MTKQEILDEVRKLPPVERVDLVMDAWDLLEEDALGLSAELCDELDRRIAEDDAYDAPAEPVEVVVARIMRAED